MDWSKCKKKRENAPIADRKQKVDWSKCKKKRENAPIANRKQKSGLEQV